MNNGERTGSKESLQENATAAELIRKSQVTVSSTFRRIRDRDTQRECFTANDILFRVWRRLSANIPNEYLEEASARIILEDIRVLRNKIEDVLESKGEGKISFIDFLSQEFIDKFLDLAREAEFLIHKPNGKTH